MSNGRDGVWENPIGTNGIEFIEYAAPDPTAMGKLFEQLGFRAVARHRRKDVTLYRQGNINFLINAEPQSFAQRFAQLHGPSICAMAFRVQDAAVAYSKLRDLGAWGIDGEQGPMELNIPAIKGIGDSLIYLVDRWRGKTTASSDISIYDVDFDLLPNADTQPSGHGFLEIDHLTHNVYRGRLNEWASFYQRLFNFREVRYFNLEGRATGIKSRAMYSPCGKIRIPINEEGNDAQGQIQEYLDRYHGEGIQHIALSTTNLYGSVDSLNAAGIRLLDTPDTYYELVDKRIEGHGESVAELKQRKILIDGEPGKLLLQIFSENLLGPVFFEFIERKGNDGFGEGNFKALFESLELDQIRRGVLQVPDTKSP